MSDVLTISASSKALLEDYGFVLKDMKGLVIGTDGSGNKGAGIYSYSYEADYDSKTLDEAVTGFYYGVIETASYLYTNNLRANKPSGIIDAFSGARDQIYTLTNSNLQGFGARTFTTAVSGGIKVVKHSDVYVLRNADIKIYDPFGVFERTETVTANNMWCDNNYTIILDNSGTVTLDPFGLNISIVTGVSNISQASTTDYGNTLAVLAGNTLKIFSIDSGNLLGSVTLDEIPNHICGGDYYFTLCYDTHIEARSHITGLLLFNSRVNQQIITAISADFFLAVSGNTVFRISQSIPYEQLHTFSDTFLANAIEHRLTESGYVVCQKNDPPDDDTTSIRFYSIADGVETQLSSVNQDRWLYMDHVRGDSIYSIRGNGSYGDADDTTDFIKIKSDGSVTTYTWNYTYCSYNTYGSLFVSYSVVGITSTGAWILNVCDAYKMNYGGGVGDYGGIAKIENGSFSWLHHNTADIKYTALVLDNLDNYFYQKVEKKATAGEANNTGVFNQYEPIIFDHISTFVHGLDFRYSYVSLVYSAGGTFTANPDLIVSIISTPEACLIRITTEFVDNNYEYYKYTTDGLTEISSDIWNAVHPISKHYAGVSLLSNGNDLSRAGTGNPYSGFSTFAADVGTFFRRTRIIGNETT